MSVSVVIPHYYLERTGNLKDIVREHERATVRPDEIIIWNNEPNVNASAKFSCLMGWDPFGRVKVIDAHRNVGCSARFLAAMTAQSEFILFQDNDVSVEKDTLYHMLSFYNNFPGRAITSLEGRRLLPRKPYRDALKVDGFGRKDFQTIHVSLGRLELVPKQVVNDLLSYIPFSDSAKYDDILFSHAAEVNGVPRFVLPSNSGTYFYNLDEKGVGAWHQPNHFSERDVLCSKFWPNEAREHDIDFA